MMKMRKYNFEQYKADIKEKYYKNFEKLERSKTAASRPGKEEDINILIEMAKSRREKWLESGKLKILGERNYKLEI